MTTRDDIALALFCQMYENDTADDPEFPVRIWRQMNSAQKRTWLRQADVAMRAIANGGGKTDHRLAYAVILFHQGTPWTDRDRVTWQELTGTKEASTHNLCDYARRVMEGAA